MDVTFKLIGGTMIAFYQGRAFCYQVSAYDNLFDSHDFHAVRNKPKSINHIRLTYHGGYGAWGYTNGPDKGTQSNLIKAWDSDDISLDGLTQYLSEMREFRRRSK